jgi:hypothetical protein
MSSLRSNLVKRIDRLPKPANVAEALQPLFEAISNAIHSTQEKFDRAVSAEGRVVVTISTDRKKDDVSATVEDNGVGLNEKNWDAFTTTDTANKIGIGGKGVGLWLDCFKDIRVVSVFISDKGPMRRSFRFVLAVEDQIQDYRLEAAPPGTKSSFHVKFVGLRDNEYQAKFPGRGNFIFQHLTSHFLPVFIGGRSPQIVVHVADETRYYPEDINKIVHRREPDLTIQSEEYGELRLTLMECDKVASADLKGYNFVHFIAHDRTVHSQNIDGKLGLKYFSSRMSLSSALLTRFA